MPRLRWPDSTNSVSDFPGTIQPQNLDDCAMKKILVGAAAFGCIKVHLGQAKMEIPA